MTRSATSSMRFYFKGGGPGGEAFAPPKSSGSLNRAGGTGDKRAHGQMSSIFETVSFWVKGTMNEINENNK